MMRTSAPQKDYGCSSTTSRSLLGGGGSGIKRLTTLANKRFNKLLRDLIAQVEKDYEVRSGTRSAKNVRVTLDPVGRPEPMGISYL